ncbi:MAG: hypothetical protein GDA48_10195 [Hormoscilla sp. GM102CHS1]|nr:hypothetical protein [Hormoscilla sp. GM102CHS1]
MVVSVSYLYWLTTYSKNSVKSLVRMFPTRAMSAREQLIELALMLIGTNTFKNWFTKCCYCTN